jgi:hypothetical protein
MRFVKGAWSAKTRSGDVQAGFSTQSGRADAETEACQPLKLAWKRMKTSRASLNRLLDPEAPSVTLLTLEKAAAALGKRLRIEVA